jgi:hypothetical protein
MTDITKFPWKVKTVRAVIKGKSTVLPVAFEAYDREKVLATLPLNELPPEAVEYLCQLHNRAVSGKGKK